MKGKRKAVVFLTAVLMSVSILSIPAYAQTPTPATYANPFSQFVAMIAQKFGLDKKQVRQVANEYRQEKKQKRQEKMQNRQDNRLDELVKEGKITEEQKNKIIEKMTEIRNKNTKEALKNMTPEERKAAFEKEREELKTWAATEGIDMQYVMPGNGRGRMMLRGDQ